MRQARLIAESESWGQSLNFPPANITSDGVDAFRYDKVSRLVSGTANGATQTATYDSFGNIKTLGAATLSPVATTNRLPATLAAYAANGAVTAYGGDLFDLDPFGMIQAAHDATYSSKYWVFIYTADDERIWKYDMGPANTSWWKLRDLGGKVLSEYVNVGASWTAVSSYIYRDGTLLGRYAPGTSYPRRWFAVDHLGTPPRTFGENGSLIEAASYFPFGGHATTPGPAEESLRFTSHERDTAVAGGIDYMHARFYAPGVGRFLSIDPKRESGRATQPQSWNRYSYARNRPVVLLDPDGREPEAYLLVTGKTFDLLRHSAIYIKDTDARRPLDLVYSHGGARNGVGPLKHYLSGYNPQADPTQAYRLDLSSPEVERLKQNLDTNYTIKNGHYASSLTYNAVTNNCAQFVCDAVTSATDMNVLQQASTAYMEMTGQPLLSNHLLMFLNTIGIIDEGLPVDRITAEDAESGSIALPKTSK